MLFSTCCSCWTLIIIHELNLIIPALPVHFHGFDRRHVDANNLTVSFQLSKFSARILIFCFPILFFNMLFWAYIFLHSPTRSSFFLFQIFLQKVSKPTKFGEKVHSFYKTVRSKNLTLFTNLNSLGIKIKMLMKHSQKAFSLYKHVSVCYLKKHMLCTICFVFL